MLKKFCIFILCSFQFFILIAQQSSMQDLAYGKDSLQKMDVYIKPNSTMKSPLVILVHCGGWMAGDKKDFNFMRDALLEKNVNVININYRLASADIHYQQIMDDMRSALTYIATHVGEWHIRDHGFVLWGNSAGGHLVLLYAYNYAPKNLISAVISFGGPTRLDDAQSLAGVKPADLNGLLPLITGKPFDKDHFAPEYHAASPYYGKNFVPTLIIHGTHDHTVPPAQSEMLHKELDQNGIENIYLPLINGGHGGEGASKGSHEKFNTVTLEWILKHSN